jgi:hypothetical protein
LGEERNVSCSKKGDKIMKGIEIVVLHIWQEIPDSTVPAFWLLSNRNRLKLEVEQNRIHEKIVVDHLDFYCSCIINNKI